MSFLKTSPQSSLDWKSLSGIWLVLASLLFSGAVESSAQTIPSKEYQIKAVFLFNFVQFVEWPTNAFPDARAPLVIGVLGENPFGGALDEIFKGETITNRKMVVHYSPRAQDLKNCQIVFVCKSEAARLHRILQELDGQNSLTVGECDGFAQSGGVINFFLENGKVRFEINPDAAKREKLEINSQLYRLGKIVTPAPPN